MRWIHTIGGECDSILSCIESSKTIGNHWINWWCQDTWLQFQTSSLWFRYWIKVNVFTNWRQLQLRLNFVRMCFDGKQTSPAKHWSVVSLNLIEHFNQVELSTFAEIKHSSSYQLGTFIYNFATSIHSNNGNVSISHADKSQHYIE